MSVLRRISLRRKNEMKTTNNELNDLQHLFGVDVDPHDSYDVKREAAAQGIRVVMRSSLGAKVRVMMREWHSQLRIFLLREMRLGNMRVVSWYEKGRCLWLKQV